MNTNFHLKDSSIKQQHLKDAMLEHLNSSCSECGITNNMIEIETFTCYPDSLSHIIYRGKVESISEITSVSLISYIDEWMSSGPNVSVAGVETVVDSECLVTNLSLSEADCLSASLDQTTILSVSILGGVVAAVIFVVAILTVIVAVKKHKQQHTPNKKHEG